MSFIVKDVPIPKSCSECPYWWEDFECLRPSYCKAGSKYMVEPLTGTDELGDSRRPDDCPLFELKEWKYL